MNAQITKILPVDEAKQDPSFFAFRTRLLTSIRQRDTTFLYGALAKDILNSFGGNGGIAEFKAQWRPEDPDSKLWQTLSEVLALGGQFEKSFEGERMFVAPYVFSARPSVAFDSYKHGVIIGRDVRVRRQPDLSSPTIAKLSFDVVRADWTVQAGQGAAKRLWIAVQLVDGARGFVAAKYIRSPIDYRAAFVLRDGRWLLKFLIAGD
ncbi:MAG: hypothetical protein ACR2L2_17650 [Acidobacteriota bacterium]